MRARRCNNDTFFVEAFTESWLEGHREGYSSACLRFTYLTVYPGNGQEVTDIPLQKIVVAGHVEHARTEQNHLQERSHAAG